jgi:uncharacterized membrane protein (DUF2068 family)
LIVAGETTKAYTQTVKKRAPTLYAIIAMKLLKGLLFVSLALVAYALSDNDLNFEYSRFVHSRLLHFLRVNPESKFFTDVAIQVGNLNESRMLHVAIGTLLYSLFSLVEGVGLIFRVSWAGWLAIGESAFFIPIEVYELVHRFALFHRISKTVTVILVINVVIVWYLLKNRQRLFHHGTPRGS